MLAGNVPLNYPQGHNLIGGHYIRTWCPCVRTSVTKRKRDATDTMRENNEYFLAGAWWVILNSLNLYNFSSDLQMFNVLRHVQLFQPDFIIFIIVAATYPTRDVSFFVVTYAGLHWIAFIPSLDTGIHDSPNWNKKCFNLMSLNHVFTNWTSGKI